MRPLNIVSLEQVSIVSREFCPLGPQTLIDIYLDSEHIGKKVIPSSKEPIQQSIFQRYDLKRKEHSIKIVLEQGVLALDAIGIYP